MSEPRKTDDSLLELAEVVLRKANFRLQYDRIGGDEPVLLVENSDAVAAVAAFLSVRDLIEAESDVSRAVSRRVASAPASPKRWDAYVVLLTSARSAAQYSEELALLTQNLRHVRRIVRVGVDPTRAGLTRALRPLLPLAAINESRWDEDPLGSMRRLLERDGFEAREIEKALDDFQLTRSTTQVDADLLATGEDDDA